VSSPAHYRYHGKGLVPYEVARRACIYAWLAGAVWGGLLWVSVWWVMA
jgi:hypothetical protein